MSQNTEHKKLGGNDQCNVLLIFHNFYKTLNLIILVTGLTCQIYFGTVFFGGANLNSYPPSAVPITFLAIHCDISIQEAPLLF